MNDSPYRESGLGSGEAFACLFCGSECAANADHCIKCGVSCAPHSEDIGAAASFACPRCGDRLALSSFGRATIKTCGKCHGVFLPSLQFSNIVTDYLNGVELPLGTMPPPLPPGKEISRLEIVRCIGCNKEMDRVNFAARSDAIVDVCAVHGIWLDPGELIPMLHFVKTRADLGEVPLSDAEKEDMSELRVALIASRRREYSANIAATTVLATLRRGR